MKRIPVLNGLVLVSLIISAPAPKFTPKSEELYGRWWSEWGYTYGWMTLYRDGAYTHTSTAIEERGRWRLEGDTLILEEVGLWTPEKGYIARKKSYSRRMRFTRRWEGITSMGSQIKLTRQKK